MSAFGAKRWRSLVLLAAGVAALLLAARLLRRPEGAVAQPPHRPDATVGADSAELVSAEGAGGRAASASPHSAAEPAPAPGAADDEPCFRIGGLVADRAGTPIGGCTVRAWPRGYRPLDMGWDAESDGAAARPLHETTAATDGSFAFECLDPAVVYEVDAYGEGTFSRPATVSYPQGARTLLEVDYLCSVVVRLRDATGGPLRTGPRLGRVSYSTEVDGARNTGNYPVGAISGAVRATLPAQRDTRNLLLAFASQEPVDRLPIPYRADIPGYRSASTTVWAGRETTEETVHLEPTATEWGPLTVRLQGYRLEEWVPEPERQLELTRLYLYGEGGQSLSLSIRRGSGGAPVTFEGVPCGRYTYAFAGSDAPFAYPTEGDGLGEVVVLHDGAEIEVDFAGYGYLYAVLRNADGSEHTGHASFELRLDYDRSYHTFNHAPYTIAPVPPGPATLIVEEVPGGAGEDKASFDVSADKLVTVELRSGR
ncbi:MAG: hypothetical protein AAF682_29040 [Planctomycetota bacterium]